MTKRRHLILVSYLQSSLVSFDHEHDISPHTFVTQTEPIPIRVCGLFTNKQPIAVFRYEDLLRKNRTRQAVASECATLSLMFLVDNVPPVLNG